MKEIIEILVNYVSIWAPSVVSIMGIIITTLKANAAFRQFKSDQTIKNLSIKMDNLARENAELIRCNKLLLDKITHINGYADAKLTGDNRHHD